MNTLLGIAGVVLGMGACANGWIIRQRGRTIQAGNCKIASAGVDGEAEVVPYKIRRETSISGDDYRRLSPGVKVAIRYLPDVRTT